MKGAISPPLLLESGGFSGFLIWRPGGGVSVLSKSKALDSNNQPQEGYIHGIGFYTFAYFVIKALLVLS
jgi:hypothetical protein